MKKIFIALVLCFVCSFAYSQSIQNCSGCHGHGVVACPSCKGYGQISVFNPYYGCYFAQLCPQCSGYKVLVCAQCSGQGQIVVNSISFGGKKNTPPNNSSDGYIYQGKSVKVGNNYYKYYRKEGHGYYWNGYSFIRCD